MEYSKIVSVTGFGGLFELVGTKADGAVVRSLEDNTIKFVSSRIHNFSHLESIEVFTTKDNTRLGELFTAMKNSEEKMPDAKVDGKELKAYFEKVFPDLDSERVYASDMKKMIKWYGILVANNIDFTAANLEEDPDNTSTDKLKTVNNPRIDNAYSKSAKPTKSGSRKIESRGVK